MLQYDQEDVRNGVVVIKAMNAKALIKKGYQVIDIKPDRNYRGRTIFIFRDEGTIREELSRMLAENRQNRAEYWKRLEEEAAGIGTTPANTSSITPFEKETNDHENTDIAV